MWVFSTEEEEVDEFNKSDITNPALIRLTNCRHVLDFMTPNKTVSKQYGLCLDFDCRAVSNVASRHVT